MLAALLLLHAASGAVKKSSTKKRVHVAAPRKAHGNWAPGYRSGGDERQPLREADEVGEDALRQREVELAHLGAEEVDVLDDALPREDGGGVDALVRREEAAVKLGDVGHV